MEEEALSFTFIFNLCLKFLSYFKSYLESFKIYILSYKKMTYSNYEIQGIYLVSKTIALYNLATKIILLKCSKNVLLKKLVSPSARSIIKFKYHDFIFRVIYRTETVKTSKCNLEINNVVLSRIHKIYDKLKFMSEHLPRRNSWLMQSSYLFIYQNVELQFLMPILPVNLILYMTCLKHTL